MTAMMSLLQLLLQFFLVSSAICSETPRLQSDNVIEEARSLLRIAGPSTRSTSASSQNGLTYYGKQLFTQLFLSGPLTSTSSNSETPATSQPLKDAVALLEDAADQENKDAMYMLAEMNFYGNYSHPRNYSEAFKRYMQLAALDGNATAQHMVGFMYATGIGGAVEQDQAKALIYYTFAAEQGDIRAQMAVGYRYHAGISTSRNCDEAVYYYGKVADTVMTWLRTGPPGNHMVVRDSIRIADEEGGVYGEGASVSSAGVNAKHGLAQSDAHASVEDVIEYLDLMSRKGDLKATFSLAKIYYDGDRGMKRDLRLARTYFLEVARTVWPKNKSKQEVPSSTEKLASKAAGFLGRMFLRGEGVKQDFELAKIWLKRGIQNGDSLSQYSLGIMHLDGLGVSKDPVKAAEYFTAAADDNMASAQVRLGVLYLDSGDKDTALKYFDLAARLGHIEAYYYLAELSYQGIGRDKSCPVAAAYYKIVAEKAETILASFKEANEAYRDGDTQTALLDYLLAAEQGFEAAQANVAYILDQAQIRYRLPTLSLSPSAPVVSQIATEPSLALLHWTRSAKQANIDSLIKMGDYYLSGVGVPSDAEKAASCYHAAAETMASAQAYWNLGWMYENGIGMGQDFHLSKRYYDLALETNKEAYLPVTMALFKLRARSAWNRWTGGGVKDIEEEPARRKTWTEWLNAFLEADADLYRRTHDDPDGEHVLEDENDWYHNHADGGPGNEYDDLDFDDGIVEAVLIIGVASLLAVLMMYRRRRQEERERANQGGGGQGGGGDVAQGQNGQQDGAGGMFPPPGDPAFPDWVAGGVGH